MDEIEKYSYFYKEKKILIETGKKHDNTGEMIYYAKSGFGNIVALAECKDAALEKCVKKIKFSMSLSEKNIILMKQEQAVALAKRYF